MTSKNPYFQAGIFLALVFTAVAMVFGARNHRHHNHRGHHHTAQERADANRSHSGAGHAASLVYKAAPSVTVGLPAVTDNRKFEIPTWPGCKQKAYEDRLDCTRKKYVSFLKSHLNIPEGRKGRVAALFDVELNGQMSNAKLHKETDPFLAAEVMRLVGIMQGADLRWTPGTRNGKPAVLKMGLFVSFGQRCRDCAEVDVELQVME